MANCAVSSGNNPTVNDSEKRSGALFLAQNSALLVVLWIVYTAVRNISASDIVAAGDHAETVIQLQQRLRFPSEATLQNIFLPQTWLIRSANLYYFGAHFPATIIFFVWLGVWHPEKFTRARNAIIITTVTALAIHVIYPLKPPRMMLGFADTAQLLGPDPYNLAISTGANQLAAMPSLHVGWAILVAIGVITASSNRFRWLFVLHPIVTLMVVVLTANHYWIDTIVAAAIVAAAWRVTRPGDSDLTKSDKHVDGPSEASCHTERNHQTTS